MPYLGETFRVTATITDINGVALLAPDSQLASIYHPDGTLHSSSAAPTPMGGGVFYHDFSIPAADPVGVWLIVWSATEGTITGIAKLKIFINDPP